MYIPPDSQIYFGNIAGFDNTYKHSAYFLSKSDQEAYFLTRLNRSLTAQSYRKTDGQNKIRVQLPYATASKFNYMMFKNAAYENKWFYAFVTHVEFVSAEVTAIDYEIDVIQSYFWDYLLNECFIEREHVEDDTRGLHTCAEPIDAGPMKCHSATASGFFDEYQIVVADAFEGS